MYRILLADDVRVTLAMEKAYLEEHNLRVTTTTSATDALHLARSLSPDLVVLDFEMPEMTGADVCTALRMDPQAARIPVLILSIRDDPAIRHRCQEAGVTRFVRKADGRDALLEAVARVLGVQRRRALRVPCRFTVGLSGERRWHEGVVCDVSAGGMLLAAAARMDVGNALQARFCLPGSDRGIEVLGEIVRLDESAPENLRFGVQFLQTTADSHAILKAFMERSI